MLFPSSQLIDIAVMSLQTGGEVARTSQIIIDPTNFNILGFELEGKTLIHSPSFLRLEDIRELSDIGLIIDSSDEIIGLDDIVTHREYYDRVFNPVGMRVIDEQKTKLGKVENTIFSSKSFAIEQFNVRKPLFKSFGDTETLISRRQVLDITDKEIIVRSPTVHAGRKPAKIPKEFTNPFHGTATPQPDTAGSHATKTHKSHEKPLPRSKTSP